MNKYLAIRKTITHKLTKFLAIRDVRKTEIWLGFGF